MKAIAIATTLILGFAFAGTAQPAQATSLETTIFAQNVPTAPVLLRAVKESDGSGGNGAQRNSRVHRSPRDDERIYTARRGCDAFGHSYKGSTHGNCDLRNSERQLRGSNGLFELIFGNRN